MNNMVWQRPQGLLSLPRLIVFAIVFFSILLVTNSKASALSGSEFRAGNIIDDSIFYNSQTMSPTDIQNFLNAKVPTCDTNGSQMHSSGRTRAQHGTANGAPPPYICLKDYTMDVPTVVNSGSDLCGGTITGGTKTAARIIYDVAQACGVNPKVLLVLLQKEQSLISDDWPWPIQYRSATGYGCPDTAPCDAEFYGFFNQVYQSAKAYKRYAANAANYNYRAGRNNTILWHPNAACGSSSVYIQNQATAGLYIYTPYQPNQAALNNLYGTGDSCSAYGNRNFWRMFSDWFGSTRDNIPTSYTIRLVGNITTSPAKPRVGEQVTVTYTVKNYDINNPLNYQNTVLQCRLNQFTNCDAGWSGGGTINANSQKTFTHTIESFPGGDITLTPYFSTGGVWYRYGADGANANILSLNIPDLRLTTPITMSPSNPVAGQPVTISFNVKNFSTKSAPLATTLVQCRYNTSTNCDTPYGGAMAVLPGEEYTFTYYLPALQEGTYSLAPLFKIGDTWYSYHPGAAPANAITHYAPDLRLVGDISVSPTSPIPGQPVTVTYTVRNFSSSPAILEDSVLQCRYNTANVCDPAHDGALTIAAGTQRTFTVSMPAVSNGRYVYKPYFRQNGVWYLFANGTAAANSMTVDVPAFVADVRLVGDVVFSPTNPIPGQPVTVTYTVQNFSTNPAIFENSILQCRYITFLNCDPSADGPLTINSGAQRTFTVSMPAVSNGDYMYKPYFKQNGTWYLYGKGTASNNVSGLSVPAFVADLRLVGDISVSPTSPIPGQPVTVTYTVRNFSSSPAILEDSVLQCRYNTANVCDPAHDGALTIAAGTQRTFTVSMPAVSNGRYVYKPYFRQNGVWYLFANGTAAANSMTVDVP